jgi:hypothetical protein
MIIHLCKCRTMCTRDVACNGEMNVLREKVTL